MGFHPKNTVHKMGRPKNIGVHSTGYSLKFKEGTDIKRALNVILWTMEGLAAKEKDELKGRGLPLTELDKNKILAETDIYLEIMKNCFYK